MRKTLIPAVLILALGAAAAYGEEEDWYLHLYVGTGLSVSYPDWVNDEFDWADANVGNQSGLDMEFEMGFYWPLNNDMHSLLGFMLVCGMTTMYSDDNADSTDSVLAMMSPGMFTVSYQQYFSDEIGVGPFFRADLGVLAGFITVTNDYNKTSRTETGFGYLIGGGYSWLPEGWETRISVQVHYQGVSADGTAGALSAGAAWLF